MSIRLFHLSDLHLGIRVNEMSLLEDQEYILKQILEQVDAYQPDGILIAGDVYDRSVPGEEAMNLWDYFLGALAKREIPVYVISGNHDSAVRLADHHALIHASGVHIAPAYQGKDEHYLLKKEGLSVRIHLLPFIKPISVSRYMEEVEIKTYTDACREAIHRMECASDEVQILVAHQYVGNPRRSESEEQVVGGLDCVEASLFEGFDYVALGHIHGPQNVGSGKIRYCGTPLKYSLSEAHDQKSITMLTIRAKEDMEVTEIPLTPRRELREIEGTFKELMESEYSEDYIYAVLTDEEEIIDGMAKLRHVFPHVMKLRYNNTRTRMRHTITAIDATHAKSEMELIEEFYEMQNNQPMSEAAREFCQTLVEKIF